VTLLHSEPLRPYIARLSRQIGLVERESIYAVEPPVDYRPEGLSGQCVHYRFPLSCELVQGPISLFGWCRFFRAQIGQ
jgi:hypothetical protein